jgi:hypothetical protein
VIDLSIFRADRATTSQREPAEVAVAIDRCNNEGGFVADDDDLGSWRRRRCSGSGV